MEELYLLLLFDVVSNKSGGILTENLRFVRLCLPPSLFTVTLLYDRPVGVHTIHRRADSAAFAAQPQVSTRQIRGFLCTRSKRGPRASKCEHVAGLPTLPQAGNRCENGAASPQKNGSIKCNDHTTVNRDQITFPLMCSDLHNSKDIK